MERAVASAAWRGTYSDELVAEATAVVPPRDLQGAQLVVLQPRSSQANDLRDRKV